MLIGVAAAELSHKKAAGTASGFVGWVAYLGSATAGYPLGKMTQELGWTGFFGVLACCGFISVCLLLPLWNVVPASRKQEKKQLSLNQEEDQILKAPESNAVEEKLVIANLETQK
jgi:sugar phosphate permease